MYGVGKTLYKTADWQDKSGKVKLKEYKFYFPWGYGLSFLFKRAIANTIIQII